MDTVKNSVKKKKRRRKHNKKLNLIIGIVLIGALMLAALLADIIAPYDYDEAILKDRFMPPCAEHLLGTDAFGRDVYSRLLYGTRIALQVVAMSVSIQLVIGVTIGLVAGYFGGRLDSVLCFFMDVTWSLPPIVMAFAVIAVLGKTLNNAIIAIALVSWSRYARIVRSKTMSIKNMAFIETAVAFGETRFSQIFYYILPNILPSIIVIASTSIPGAIISTTSLSFLGLGAQAPSPDWGLALSESIERVTTAPWLAIFPGVALAFTTYGFAMLGDGIRDMLDPRMKTR